MGQNCFTVALYDEQTGTRTQIECEVSSHAFYREVFRGKAVDEIKRVLTEAFSNPDTWDLLDSVVSASVETRHHVRYETYKIPSTGLFFQTNNGSVILGGRLETGRIGRKFEVKGNISVITYIGAEMTEGFKYYNQTAGLVYYDNCTIPMYSDHGRLVEAE